MSHSIISDISYAATTVTVTEYIPGAGCNPIDSSDPSTHYECTIES